MTLSPSCASLGALPERIPNCSPSYCHVFCFHRIIHFPPARSVLPRQQEPYFSVAEFFVKGNPVTAHVFFITLGPVARTSQNLPGRKNLVPDRADKVILDNLFSI